MVRVKILSTFTLLLLLLFTKQCYSATTPRPNPADEYLTTHNEARSAVGVSPLQWSPSLAKSASLIVRLQRDKQNCTFANLSSSQYGGNQHWASGRDVTPRAVVENWVAEKTFYNYAKNECAQGHQCGVYTQVVWKKSTELGCAQAVCPNQQHSSLTVCFYNPPGNIVGEKPY